MSGVIKKTCWLFQTFLGSKNQKGLPIIPSFCFKLVNSLKMANAVQFQKVQIDVRGCTQCVFHVYIWAGHDQSGKGSWNSAESHPIKL